MATPSVTWMIPLLNSMAYLRQTLESIERQTFSDFQVLLWDNGSTDGTVEELHRWVPGRLPGRVVTDRPLLLGLARAAMVNECETEFCALIDADDINHPDRLEKQMQFMQSHPEVAVLGTQLRKIDAHGQDHGIYTQYQLEHERIVQQMLLTNPIGQPSVLMRRSAVLATGNYRDFSPTHVEDYDLWLRMAAAGHRLANLPDARVNYRVHEKSTTQQSLAANRLDEVMKQRLAEVAPMLYGCDGPTVLQLRERKHPQPLVPLQQIAMKLGAGRSDPWKSPVFYNAARSMIADRDVRSRIAAAMENRGVTGGVSEAGRIAMALLRKLLRRSGNQS